MLITLNVLTTDQSNVNFERYRMKKFSAVLLGLVASAATLPALAQFAKPEDAIKYRQNALFVMQQNFGRVAGMAQGKIPFDAKVAQDSAVAAEFVGKLPWAAFGPNTDFGEIPTQAKPEIWKNRAKFDDYAGKMQGAMEKLVIATKSGKLDDIKPAVNAVGGTCKSCHDDFRSK